VAIQDQIEQVVRELWRMNQVMGWQQRIGWDDGSAMGRLAKASGVTEVTVMSWLAGDSLPATGQALALMSALPHPALPVAALSGARS
jgi:hypothetical protein